MAEDDAHFALEVTKIIPNCPLCGCGRYYSVTENAGEEFRLKALRCEACQFDVLGAYRKISPTSRLQKPSPVLFGLLACLVVVELVFLIEIIATE